MEWECQASESSFISWDFWKVSLDPSPSHIRTRGPPLTQRTLRALRFACVILLFASIVLIEIRAGMCAKADNGSTASDVYWWYQVFTHVTGKAMPNYVAGSNSHNLNLVIQRW